MDEIDDTDRPTLLVHKEERLYDATRAERTNLQFFDSCLRKKRRKRKRRLETKRLKEIDDKGLINNDSHHKSPLIGLEGFGREESKVELG